MAVPARAIAQRKIIARFFEQDATSPQKALAFMPDRFVQRRAFERLQRQEVIRSAGVDRWYVDVPTYQRYSNARRKKIVVVTAIAASLGALLGIVR